jgi:hypothetical protein
MILRCPCCRATGLVGVACRRCKADLSPLLAVQARRDWLLATGWDAAQDGDLDQTTAAVHEAESLHADADTARLRALVALLSGDYAEAWACYTAVNDERNDSDRGR